MTKNELEDIKEYLEKKKSLSLNFKNHPRLYSFTTENISSYLNNFDLRDKKVLTVGGSGDQRLNALLLGAKEVTCFDINPLTELHIKLKDEVIKNVDLHDFIRFFGVNENINEKEYYLLHNRIFDSVKDSLDETTFDFFDYVINKSYFVSPKDIYFESVNSVQDLKRINNYMTLDKYLELRDILEKHKVDFIHSDILNLKDHLDDEKYDFILLSNISDYIHYVYPTNEVENFKKLIESFDDNLNDNGIIEVGYIYSYYLRGEDISDFHYPDVRSKYFKMPEYKTIFVPAYFNDGSYDKVLTYQKVL